MRNLSTTYTHTYTDATDDKFAINGIFDRAAKIRQIVDAMASDDARWFKTTTEHHIADLDAAGHEARRAARVAQIIALLSVPS